MEASAYAIQQIAKRMMYLDSLIDKEEARIEEEQAYKRKENRYRRKKNKTAYEEWEQYALEDENAINGRYYCQLLKTYTELANIVIQTKGATK